MKSKFEIIQKDQNSFVSIAPVMQDLIDFESNTFINEEKEELEKIKNPQYKAQWISARLLASDCKSYINSQTLNINKKLSGKPYILGSEFHISLSHNPKMAAVMFSKTECGIDIEQLRPKILRIQDKFLSEEERKRYFGNIELLTLIWSAKESIYKALEISGLIFKEEINCKLDTIYEKGNFFASVHPKNQPSIEMKIHYQILEDQILTYCNLGEAV